MPFCTKCGGQVADSANFCTHCGAASSGTAAAPAVTLSGNKAARINQEWDALAPSEWGSKKHANERAMLSGLLDDSESLAGLVSGNFEFNVDSIPTGASPRTAGLFFSAKRNAPPRWCRCLTVPLNPYPVISG